MEIPGGIVVEARVEAVAAATAAFSHRPAVAGSTVDMIQHEEKKKNDRSFKR